MKEKIIQFLENNGFKKTKSKDKNLMEWTKNEFGSKYFIMVYLYDEFEIYFNVVSDFKFKTLDELKEILHKNELKK